MIEKKKEILKNMRKRLLKAISDHDEEQITLLSIGIATRHREIRKLESAAKPKISFPIITLDRPCMSPYIS